MSWFSLFIQLIFFSNTSALFIGVCKIAIGAAVCARLIPTWVGVRTCQMTCSFCICFTLCASRENLVLVTGWDASNDASFWMCFALCVLRVRISFPWSARSNPSWNCWRVWWLNCGVYSLREGVTTSLGGGTASNDKRRRRATIKEGGKQQ